MKKLFLLLLMFCSGAFAKDTMRIYLARPPGGAHDVIARQFVKVITENENIDVIVLNKPGGDGAIAANELLSDKASDYAVFLSATPLFIYSATKPKILERVTPVIPLSEGAGFMFVTQKNSRFQTWKDLTEYVKNNTVNIGTASHQCQFLAEDVLTNGKTNMVPFQGDTPVLANMLNKTLDIGVINVAGNIDRLDGMGLAVLAGAIETMPGIPVLKSPHGTYSNAIFVSDDMPKNKMDRVHEIFARALKDPAIIAFYKQNNYLIPKSTNRQYFIQDLESRINAVKNHKR